MSFCSLIYVLYSLLNVVNMSFVFIGQFLKRFLGPINVRAIRKDVQLKVKEEYNSYKVSSFSDHIFLMI